MGFGPWTPLEQMPKQLDQFYVDGGGQVEDELLSQSCRFKQKIFEKVSAFASRLDTQIRQAKS